MNAIRFPSSLLCLVILSVLLNFEIGCSRSRFGVSRLNNKLHPPSTKGLSIPDLNGLSSSLNAPLISFLSPFGNQSTTPAVLFIPNNSSASVDHYELKILRASDNTLVKDWTVAQFSLNETVGSLFLDGLNLTVGEIYTPQIRAIDTKGLASPISNTMLIWKVGSLLGAGFGDNSVGGLGLGARDPRSPTFTTIAVAGEHTFTQLVAGAAHTCGIEFSSHKAYCWGYNGNGQLGDNSTEHRLLPVTVSAVEGSSAVTFIQLAAGDSHTCGIEALTHKAYCWGYNGNGQLGDKSEHDRWTPVKVVGVEGGPALSFSQIVAGEDYTCGIEENSGTAFCWGTNFYGQLGNNSQEPSSIPVKVAGVAGTALKFTKIAAGNLHTCGIEAITKKAYCWGANWNGQLGNNSDKDSLMPVQVLGVNGDSAMSFSQITVGYNHSCGIEAVSKKAFCWGYNKYGQLGNNSTDYNKWTPVEVLGEGGGLALSFSEIEAVEHHTCGMESITQKAYCWGDNRNGQLGDNTFDNRSTPVKVVGIGGGEAISFTQITAGPNHNCGVETETKKAYCWGSNSEGVLGNNSLLQSVIPVPILNFQGATMSFVQLEAGNNYSCGIQREDKKAYCWGDNSNGKLGNNSTDPTITPIAVLGVEGDPAMSFKKIAAGYKHTCGIELLNQKAHCWGENWQGQLGNNSQMESWTPVKVMGVDGGPRMSFADLAVGYEHTCGIEADTNKAYCWGFNGTGQLGDNSRDNKWTPVAVKGFNSGSPLSFVQIVAGGYHTCGIEATTKKAYCWGANWTGQLGNDSQDDSWTPTLVVGSAGGAAMFFTQLAAGYNHTCGIEERSKTAYCWGVNEYGQLGDNSKSTRYTPVQVIGGSGTRAIRFQQITAGHRHSCGIEEITQKAYCWGFNADGRLGFSSPSGSLTAVPVLGVGAAESNSMKFSEIKAGGNFTLGIIY